MFSNYSIRVFWLAQSQKSNTGDLWAWKSWSWGLCPTLGEGRFASSLCEICFSDMRTCWGNALQWVVVRLWKPPSSIFQEGCDSGHHSHRLFDILLLSHLGNVDIAHQDDFQMKYQDIWIKGGCTFNPRSYWLFCKPWGSESKNVCWLWLDPQVLASVLAYAFLWTFCVAKLLLHLSNWDGNNRQPCKGQVIENLWKLLCDKKTPDQHWGNRFAAPWRCDLLCSRWAEHGKYDKTMQSWHQTFCRCHGGCWHLGHELAWLDHWRPGKIGLEGHVSWAASNLVSLRVQVVGIEKLLDG